MPESRGKIHIVVINGSARPGNYTGMACALVMDEFHKHPEVSAELIEPGALQLPFPGVNSDSPGARKLQQAVSSATGVVLATPEYHGTFSSVIKLAIENLGFPSALAGKPVSLLGVAAGSIGAIKSVEHLRGVASHIGALVLPMPVSVANVQKVFDKEGHVLDPAIDKLIRRAAVNLLEYIHQYLCPKITLERLIREGVQSVTH